MAADVADVVNSWVLAVVEAGVAEHGDQDISATYLTSAPYWAA